MKTDTTVLCWPHTYCTNQQYRLYCQTTSSYRFKPNMSWFLQERRNYSVVPCRRNDFRIVQRLFHVIMNASLWFYYRSQLNVVCAPALPDADVINVVVFQQSIQPSKTRCGTKGMRFTSVHTKTLTIVKEMCVFMLLHPSETDSQTLCMQLF